MKTRTGSDPDAKHETHNIVVLAAHQILIRIAWVFKTESVIMPAFMDHIAGAGWLRGCLPVLSRVGLSIPPLLVAEKLKHTRRKKWMLLSSSLVMALPFLLLATMWYVVDDKQQTWLAVAFLSLYLFFFCAVGINTLAFGTVQGKLIRANRRGRLMSISGVIGTFFSVLSLLWWMTDWLERDDGGFGFIFGFTGLGFVIGGLMVAAVKESADPTSETPWLVAERFRQAWRIFASDTGFRRLVIVSVCFCPLMLLFPHYQTLGRDGETIQQSAGDLMIWVVTQNVAVGVYSFAAGSLADRFGNRVVLRLELLIGAMTPLVALLMAGKFGQLGVDSYWLTFALLGIAPVTLRTLVNFSLELTEPANHPQYVSTLSLCAAVPFLASPMIGYLVDLVGFRPVFLCCSLMVAFGFLMTLRLPEPRHS